ncbi:MAG: NADPH-dependent FMN reductase [Bdellovibrionales bacterium]
MKHIIVGTNRPNSRSADIAQLVQDIYSELGEKTEIVALADYPLNLLDGNQYGEDKPEIIKDLNQKMDNSDGLIVISPEYNGSMPGILKLFIDHLSFPKAFEKRPVCFVGLGGMFGGLRPVEHLQQVFGYRNAYIYPFRVFFLNVWNIIKEGKIQDESTERHLREQAIGFQKFVKGLQDQGIHANSN